MYELALFAGDGGGILGGKILGWRTVCAVEIEKYPRGVLLRRQDDGTLPAFPVWDDVTTFRSDNPGCGYFIEYLRGIADQLVISGGFPCQDISVAGKGAGITGARSGLWGEYGRLVREIRPAAVYVENSPMLTSRGIELVLGQLSEMGYDAAWGVLGAADVGANHLRKRIWIVASRRDMAQPDSGGHIQRQIEKQPAKGGQHSQRDAIPKSADVPNALEVGFQKTGAEQPATGITGICEDVADTCIDRSEESIENSSTEQPDEDGSQGRTADVPHAHGERSEEQHATHIADGQGQPGWPPDERGRGAWWAVEPPVGRVVDGLAFRVDRLKGLGNGQVPAVAAAAYTLLQYISGLSNNK